ncbi:hypothetical protein ACU4GD_16590 [Cupriavidus basilensis]
MPDTMEAWRGTLPPAAFRVEDANAAGLVDMECAAGAAARAGCGPAHREGQGRCRAGRGRHRREERQRIDAFITRHRNRTRKGGSSSRLGQPGST